MNFSLRSAYVLLTLCLLSVNTLAETHITISSPSTWTVSDLAPYIGQTVIFDTPMIVCANGYGGYKVSPRRIFQASNQALPLSAEYNQTLVANSNGQVTLTGIGEYHRTGEKIYNLKAKINSTASITFQSGTWVGNTRNDLLQGVDMSQIDAIGEHDLLVCGFNLEYYLVWNEDYYNSSSMGPSDYAEHQKQRAKISKALALINADLYGLVEIQQGTAALAEICQDLTTNTGRNYQYVTITQAASGTYTQSAYVYCSDRLEPIGKVRTNNTGVSNRKAMQVFRDLTNDEKFIYSINHFKAKSGNGSGGNADQGDGQGSYNQTRVQEAQAVLSNYRSYRTQAGDEDILIMGDLNAYAKEDPITTLLNGGMTDLHRYFHADSSYSYTYNNQAGYLDHAIVNGTLLPQVTGMCAFHINSDEIDNYTYDKSNDQTMFRSSDHDPVIVGLRLSSSVSANDMLTINAIEVMCIGADIVVRNAQLDATIPAFYRLYNSNGMLITDGQITTGDNAFSITRPSYPGVYILQILWNGQSVQKKIIIP